MYILCMVILNIAIKKKIHGPYFRITIVCMVFNIILCSNYHICKAQRTILIHCYTCTFIVMTSDPSAQVVQNEEMKLELESIIGGLQSYLTTVRQKSEGQRDEYAELVRDHEDLLEQLRDTRKQKAAADAQAAEASLLREVSGMSHQSTVEVTSVNSGGSHQSVEGSHL